MGSKAKECGHCDAQEAQARVSSSGHMHPDHSSSKRRINRAKGQLDAVARMIDERRYCPDIINQVRAATNALKALEQEILKGHLQGCVQAAFQSKDPDEIQQKISEILKLTNV